LWHQIISIIEIKHNFVLTSHINPDCDALGSELALAEHLRNLQKDVAIINSDPVPASYRFLDSKGRIKRYSSRKHAALINQADVIVVLDVSGNWQRVGPVSEALKQSQATKICIDHHPDSADFVDLAVIDTEASATAELIYDLVRTMNGSVSKNMAQALYAAILTDSGSFRFPKTSPQTHRITAELLVAGADPLYLYSQIYEQYSAGCVRLKGHVMASIRTAAAGQIAYYSLTRNDLKYYGVKSSELDGYASLGQQIGGVRITIFCLEASAGRVKISLRSDGTIAINQIALEYDGGGHPSAAGAIVPGHLDEIMAELVEKTKTLLEKNG
jgi:phosphoesterase RecJ-like protein